MVRRFTVVLALALTLVASTASVASAQGLRNQLVLTTVEPNAVRMDVMMRIHERMHPLVEQLPPQVREHMHALMHQWMMGGMEMGAR